MLRCLFGTPMPSPKVGMKWHIEYRRFFGPVLPELLGGLNMEAGQSDVFIEKVFDDGSVKLHGKNEHVNWDKYFQEHLARPHEVSRSDPRASSQQTVIAYPEYRGVSELPLRLMTSFQREVLRDFGPDAFYEIFPDLEGEDIADLPRPRME